jgi:hypothetical protein
MVRFITEPPRSPRLTENCLMLEELEKEYLPLRDKVRELREYL